MKAILIAVTGVLLGTSGLLGQEPGERVRAFQVFGATAGARALDEGFNNRVVRGKPFSATEERRSLQILQNGTRIENNQTNRLFRDSEGRLGLMDEFCAHRRASLFLGRSEENGLRCVYHGWKYDRKGNCLETPTEPAPRWLPKTPAGRSSATSMVTNVPPRPREHHLPVVATPRGPIHTGIARGHRNCRPYTVW